MNEPLPGLSREIRAALASFATASAGTVHRLQVGLAQLVLEQAPAAAPAQLELAKKHASREDAGGEAGAAGAKPTFGGSISNAGQPDAGGSGTPEPVTTGGAGGQAPVIPSGGAGGEVPLADGGASGSGGEGGEQGVCCAAKTCAELGAGCGYLDDGCGRNLLCNCGPGSSCNFADGTCSVCIADPEACIDNLNLCGDTLDNCGNPITCPDTCADSDSTAVCVGGFCCTPKAECFGNECGTISNGCGGTIDCGSSCDGGTCTNNVCCTVNNGACAEVECGDVDDGCKTVSCGECAETEGCVDHACVESACKPLGYQCGLVANPNTGGPFEECGSCAENERCIDNMCVSICR